SPLTTGVSDSDPARTWLGCVGDAPFRAGPHESPLWLAHLHGDGFQSSPYHVQAQNERRCFAPAYTDTRHCDAGKGGRLVCIPCPLLHLLKGAAKRYSTDEASQGRHTYSQEVIKNDPVEE